MDSSDGFKQNRSTKDQKCRFKESFLFRFKHFHCEIELLRKLQCLINHGMQYYICSTGCVFGQT